MNRLGKLFMATALVVVPVACKDDVRKSADKAAENLQDQKSDLHEESKELRDRVKETREDSQEMAKDYREARGKTDRLAGLPDRAEGRLHEAEAKHNAKQLADETNDVTDEAIDVAKASGEFQARRQARANQLRVVHGVKASQAMLINTLGGTTALTDRARGNLGEKMQVFQMRIDEAGNAIEQLQQVHEDNFEDRDDAATKAMERLENAREDAWEALNDGDRIQPS